MGAYRTTIKLSCALTVAANNKIGKRVDIRSQSRRLHAKAASKTVITIRLRTTIVFPIAVIEPVDIGPVMALKKGNVVAALKLTS